MANGNEISRPMELTERAWLHDVVMTTNQKRAKEATRKVGCGVKEGESGRSCELQNEPKKYAIRYSIKYGRMPLCMLVEKQLKIFHNNIGRQTDENDSVVF